MLLYHLRHLSPRVTVLTPPLAMRVSVFMQEPKVTSCKLEFFGKCCGVLLLTDLVCSNDSLGPSFTCSVRCKPRAYRFGTRYLILEDQGLLVLIGSTRLPFYIFPTFPDLSLYVTQVMKMLCTCLSPFANSTPLVPPGSEWI